MKDMYNVEVVNGDLMSEGHEDYSYIFRMENNKLVLRALIENGKLKKYTEEDVKETTGEIQNLINTGKIPSFMKGVYTKTLSRIQEIKPESLCKVRDTDSIVINRFINEGHELIEYSI